MRDMGTTGNIPQGSELPQTWDSQHLVELIHASPKLAVIAVAGAGSQALAWLLGVPGASRTVLEAIVPYGRRSMAEFLGHEPLKGGTPIQYVSPEMAIEMAESAYRKALRMREAQETVVGLACTATIATDRPKRGEHRCCVAAWDGEGATTYNLKLAKGQRDRPGEEDVVSRLVLRALAEAFAIKFELPLGLLDTERLEVHRTDHATPLRRLLAAADSEGCGGEVRTVTVYPDGRMAADEPIGAAVLPGSFSPLHQGHEWLAQVASEMLNAQVVFELSVVNVDKTPLEEAEVRRRLRQFQGSSSRHCGWCAVLTRAPTFREKAALFPGCTFIVGWDTAVRLVHPRYYGGREGGMHGALAEIRAAGCCFLVAGRAHEDIFRTLADVAIPREFTDLFEAIPESRFRADISSTELRSAKRQN